LSEFGSSDFFILASVPAPLVDLGLGEVELLGELSDEMLVPVGVNLEELLEHPGLVLGHATDLLALARRSGGLALR
jgi:hypothetical protein